jgi:hypothetical protein
VKNNNAITKRTKWRQLKKGKQYHASVSTKGDKMSFGLRTVSTRPNAYSIGMLTVSTNIGKNAVNWQEDGEDYDY